MQVRSACCFEYIVDCSLRLQRCRWLNVCYHIHNLSNYVELVTPSEVQLVAADINEDMCVNVVDAQIILRTALGI